MAVATVPEYGGYDNDFVGEVPEKFTCTICTKVLRDPHLTGCCGQHFCESCLTHWFTKHKAKTGTCPHCQEEDIVHMHNKALKREISHLKVRCTFRKDGCTWQGELGDLQAHFDSDTGCDFVEVECPNSCEDVGTSTNYEILFTTLKRKDIAKHLSSDCYLRRYKCEHCTFEGTYMAITGEGLSKTSPESYDEPYPYGSHYSKCPMAPLDCPNLCGANKIKRKDMHNHRNQCPLEKVDCPNQCSDGTIYYRNIKYGKYGGISRKDLQEHLSTECYLRKYTCEHCGLEDTYQAITGKGGPESLATFHYETCLDFPLECPNKCGAVKIKRKNIPTHREQCPLEPVQCPFQEAGCQTRLVRRDLDNHMATQTQQHLLLTFQTMKKQEAHMRRENTELNRQCYDLRKENAALKKQCNDLSKELADVKQELQTLKRKRR